ncbi:hypothetical protein ACFSWE_12905 [Leucobacter albus]|uniref:Uncharacterized protein n=1 Tax=Leucobacter albus TaxID=272210 RepID=A0ABW3TRJ7_9MICO
MSENLQLNDAVLESAARGFASAAEVMRSGAAKRPPTPATLSALRAELDLYLRGLAVSRAALSDAAHSATLALADILAQSAELDAEIAAALPAGFVLGEAP